SLYTLPLHDALPILNEQGVLADVCDVDDLGRRIGKEADAAFTFGAEADRLALLERDPVLLLLAHGVEGAVVVDVAILVDLDEGRSEEHTSELQSPDH